MQFDENRKARVMIVDDHAIVRQGMAMLIDREPDMIACCQAEKIEEAVRANRACRHDVAIVDLSLEGASGLELVRRLQFEFSDLPILVLAMHDESIYAESVLKAGARGYVMKQAATDTLLNALRQVLQGELYVSDTLRSQMLKKAMGRESGVSPVSNLSPSELEVLHLVGNGMGTAEIAAQLSRSIKTIESHKANIKRKLNLENSNQLALFAVKLVAAGSAA
ncbi:MAG TPA: DNA-binding response regulator [Actinobacteria bacterium]|nr:DNA-binding response regulator [Actinomycetota bacterium]